MLIPSRRTALLASLALLPVSTTAFANAIFNGCVISPENPTVILGALGAAGASLPWLKAQWQARRSSKD